MQVVASTAPCPHFGSSYTLLHLFIAFESLLYCIEARKSTSNLISALPCAICLPLLPLDVNPLPSTRVFNIIAQHANCKALD